MVLLREAFRYRIRLQSCVFICWSIIPKYPELDAIKAPEIESVRKNAVPEPDIPCPKDAFPVIFGSPCETRDPTPPLIFYKIFTREGKYGYPVITIIINII